MSNKEVNVNKFNLTKFNESMIQKYCVISCLLLLYLTGCGVSSGDKQDPVVVENAVAFIKRPQLLDDDMLVSDNIIEPQIFRPGAVLYIKDNASVSSQTRDLTSSVFSGDEFLNDEGVLLYDVKDLSVSYDGDKLLFAMRAPEDEDADEEDQPTWNIWEYDLPTNNLHRVISSNFEAEKGQDVSPRYLPDDRIVFASTRQTTSKAILLNENKSQYTAQDEERDSDAFVLHTMSSEGDSIKQITFNQSHDLSPVVLENGKILFSRWDNAGQTGSNGVNLYQINPDGTGLSYQYGRHSHDTGTDGDTVHFAKPRELENGNIAVELRDFELTGIGSQTTEININDFVENDVMTDGVVDGLEHAQSAIVSGLTTNSDVNLKGNYGAFFPFTDGSNRYLVSWSLCRIQLIDIDSATEGNQAGSVESCTAEKIASTNYEAAESLFGLWVLDASSNTQLPIASPEAGTSFDEAVIMSARTEANSIDDLEPEGAALTLKESGFGILHIRSVYDFDGVDTSPAGIASLADPVQTAPNERPYRFIRIEKPVSLPSDDVRDIDNTAFGRSNAQLMREIIGYAPIEPDGSVKIAVPANVAFGISLLDESGQRRSDRHQNWLQIAAGETIECVGCHTPNSEVPHGRMDAQPESINTGAVTTGIQFPNTEPALFTDMGETMAETYTRINGIRLLTPDIIYEDEWTDGAVTSKADPFEYSYSNLTTLIPFNKETCSVSSWDNACRIVINYEENLHPLWSVDRRVFDVDEVTLIEDRTCTSCHTNTDTDGATQVPVKQLDLSEGPSTDEADHFKSYRELLFNDNEQSLLNGVLIDTLEDSTVVQMVPQLDEDGAQVRDEDGNIVLIPLQIVLVDGAGDPILDINGEEQLVFVYVQQTIDVVPTMSTAGARNSNGFMDLFQTDGVHENYLTSAELKLLSEWLDLGAQYYNNPLVAPAN